MNCYLFVFCILALGCYYFLVYKHYTYLCLRIPFIGKYKTVDLWIRYSIQYRYTRGVLNETINRKTKESPGLDR